MTNHCTSKCVEIFQWISENSDEMVVSWYNQNSLSDSWAEQQTSEPNFMAIYQTFVETIN